MKRMIKIVINSINKTQKAKLIKAYTCMMPSYIPLNNNTINNYLNHALHYANKALLSEEVPIGAVIVHNEQIISYGYNQTVTNNNIIDHAEIMAIQNASRALKTHRLVNCDLYVTIEPCIMCVGAILHSRLRRVIFGAIEPKTGGVISQINNITTNPTLNHQTEFIGPIDNIKYTINLKKFFQTKR